MTVTVDGEGKTRVRDRYMYEAALSKAESAAHEVGL
jgi:hypothetical protein